MSLAAAVSEKASPIWAIADKLTGVFKPHQCGEVILPLTVIRRFDSVLEPAKQAVLDACKQYADSPLPGKLLEKASGCAFYNTSQFTFVRLLDAPDDLEANFRAYCNAFSPNVRQILERFKPFWPHLATMCEKNVLHMVLKEFTTSKADLHPDRVSNLEGEGRIEPVPAETGFPGIKGDSGATEGKDFATLSDIVRKINQRFGTQLDPTDQVHTLRQIAEHVAAGDRRLADLAGEEDAGTWNMVYDSVFASGVAEAALSNAAFFELINTTPDALDFLREQLRNIVRGRLQQPA
ncbi:type I restriction-modification system subunit M N-terminal domain-containing protein [Desulfovibrio sp. SGI.169]|uniref:type I restriction-modification system subunit M N-terminal domain-containing protein n=1 Tax=Desulfovibrio sp. SGI.169 TaxID=3420561 RepID=UPI003D047A83